MRNHASHPQNSANPMAVINSAFRKFGNSMAAQMPPEMIAIPIRKCMAEASYAH